jgi:hypothetical protein
MKTKKEIIIEIVKLLLKDNDNKAKKYKKSIRFR